MTQRESREQENFRLRVIKEDDRTRESSRSSSCRAREALDLITETLEDHSFKTFQYKHVIKFEESENEQVETMASQSKIVEVEIDEL